jgi:hypothetical protein
MKRWRFVQGLVSLPVAGAALTASAQPPAPAGQAAPELDYARALDVAAPVRRFFSDAQFTAFVRLADVLVQADALLEPLRRPWSFAPSELLERFLRTAYPDLRTATQNSRAVADATGNMRNVQFLLPLA